MGTSHWFLDQNNFFVFFLLYFTPRGTTNNLPLLNTQNRPTLVYGTHKEYLFIYLNILWVHTIYINSKQSAEVKYVIFVITVHILMYCWKNVKIDMISIFMLTPPHISLLKRSMPQSMSALSGLKSSAGGIRLDFFFSSPMYK